MYNSLLRHYPARIWGAGGEGVAGAVHAGGASQARTQEVQVAVARFASEILWELEYFHLHLRSTQSCGGGRCYRVVPVLLGSRLRCTCALQLLPSRLVLERSGLVQFSAVESGFTSRKVPGPAENEHLSVHVTEQHTNNRCCGLRENNYVRH